MPMRTHFTPELCLEMVNAYDMCSQLLGKTVTKDQIAQYIVDCTAFGIDNAVDLTLMTVNHFKAANQLMNGKIFVKEINCTNQYRDLRHGPTNNN